MSQKFGILPEDPQITIPTHFVKKRDGLKLLEWGTVERAGFRLLRLLPKQSANSCPARFLIPELPAIRYDYPLQGQCLDEDFQRCMRYPVILAPQGA